ncbi:MAG: hypothetical protein M3463_12565 [Verrucomicrobiota bacterium]|nr:hypothetical protein [Verrucomicrobiota bacterium]
MIGHTFLQTPNRVIGHYPGKRNKKGGLGGPGECRDDTPNLPAVDKTDTVDACPASVKEVEKQINKHKKDPYKLLNGKGSPNCKGWVDDVLDDAGFDNPGSNGWVPGL